MKVQTSVCERSNVTRRTFLRDAAGTALTGLGAVAVSGECTLASEAKPAVQTVLGPVAPEKLGATLMHEHAPMVDWSELFETPPAPFDPIREKMIAETARRLDAYHATLPKNQGPGAIVETTPIRIGRYPRLLADLAQRTKVHVIACTGFWCEALAPQHPWAVRLGIEKDGPKKMADFYIREITEGMEDPAGKWGERYTDIKAGIIKIGTSTYLRPSERAAHIAAAIASRETGCPITTHTTEGGGLEEAQLLLQHGAEPEKIIIGHQGYKDDRENDEADEYHRVLAGLGCFVQFDRIDHEKYPIESQARQVKRLIEGGYVRQLLVSHDHAVYVYPEFTAQRKYADRWKALDPDYTTVTMKFLASLKSMGATDADIQTILVDNPKRVLAF